MIEALLVGIILQIFTVAVCLTGIAKPLSRIADALERKEKP